MQKIDFLTQLYICLLQPRQILTITWPSLGPEGVPGGLGGSRPWGPSSKFDHLATFPYRWSGRPFFPIWTFHFHIVSYSNRFETAQNNLSRWFWSKYTFSVIYVWMMTQFEDSQNAIFGLQAILINLATFPYRCSEGAQGDPGVLRGSEAQNGFGGGQKIVFQKTTLGCSTVIFDAQNRLFDPILSMFASTPSNFDHDPSFLGFRTSPREIPGRLWGSQGDRGSEPKNTNESYF